MKIAVYADSGFSVGIGHLTRCSAIISEAENMGHSACLLTNMDTLAFITKAKEYGADCVLIDSYKWTEECYKSVKNCFYTVVIDDNARLCYPAHMLINANLYANDLDYSSCDVEVKLLGGSYAILRQEFKCTISSEFKRKVQRVLITMGGADINDYTPVVLAGLADISEIEAVIVAGPMMKCVNDVNNVAKDCKCNVTILSSPSNMAEVIKTCDIAVSSAGSTVYELCAVGVPSILIGQADNQSLICDYFTKKGYMDVLGFYSDVKPVKINQTVKRLINSPERRMKMRVDMLKLIDRNGASNIMQAVNECYCKV